MDRFPGEHKALWCLFREIPIVIGLAQHSSSDDQPGLTQEFGNTVRLPQVEIELAVAAAELGLYPKNSRKLPDSIADSGASVRVVTSDTGQQCHSLFRAGEGEENCAG